MKTQGRSSRQNPSGMPIAKYRHFLDVNPVSLPDRTWPDNRILKAPRWLSTDLRDGNQALIEPMDPARKKLMFELLIELGLKEIEIGFPAASAADLEFCRSLVEEGLVPEDVTISVLTQSRQEIIHKTVDAWRACRGLSSTFTTQPRPSSAASSSTTTRRQRSSWR